MKNPPSAFAEEDWRFIRLDCLIQRPHPASYGDHLAADRQVGEGASPSLDAVPNME
jgi:hypothetical protein